MFLLNNSSYPIGLDISDLSLKLVQLNKNRDKISIQAMSKKNLPKGYFENGIIKNKEGVINAIKDIVNNPKFGKISSDDVVACLPESKTFVKMIEVEKTPNDIKNTIETEIEKHIPMPINEMYYDWQIIKDFPSKQAIMIGAAPKEIVDQYIELLSAAKLSVVALEIEPTSICRSILAEENFKFEGDSKKNYAIIDIGATRTSLTVYSQGAILFTSSIPVSGEEITNKISASLKIDKKQAEKAKIICGLDETKAKGIIKNILSDMIKKMIIKINDSIEFHKFHFSEYGKLDQIIICGGGANIEGINNIIEEKTGINTINGDPLININYKKEKISNIFIEKHNLNIDLSENKKIKTAPKNSEVNKVLSITQDNSLSFTTAIGLAMREMFIDKI